MKRYKVWLCAVLILVCAVALFACGGEEDKTYKVDFIIDKEVYATAEGGAHGCELPEEPTLTCRNFLGWFYSASGGERFSPDTEISADTTVYAVFDVVHDYAYVIHQPTCEDGGYTEFSCRVCGDEYVGDYTEPKGHSYTETRHEPTCTQNGSVLYACACGDRYTEELPMAEHSYDAVVTPPTVKDGGYTTFICNSCGFSYRGEFTNPIEHEHDFEESHTAPTCDTQGYTTYTCTLCGFSYNDNFTDVLGHIFESEVVPPTDTAQGYTVFTCTGCGFSYIGDYTDVHSHTYKTEVKEPTCTERGYTVYTCIDCGKSYKDDYVPTAEHDYAAKVTAPTCTAEGYTVYKCQNCTHEYVGDYVSPIPHNDVGTVTEPTCITGGYTTYVCTECQRSYVSDPTPTAPHPYEKTVIPPTCYTFGYTIFNCPVCQDSYDGEIKEPLGHDIKEEIIPPTCTAEGKTKYYCTRCDYANYDNYTSSLPHNEVWMYDNEFHWYECSSCGLIADPLAPSKHNAANCECGYTAPVGTLIYNERADGSFMIIDYQGSYENPIDLYIPGTYLGSKVCFSLSLIRDDVRSLTIGEGVDVFDYVLNSESVEELIIDCDYDENEIYTFTLSETRLKKLVLPRNITTFYLANCDIGEIYIPSTVNNARIPFETSIDKVYYNGDVVDWLEFDYTASDLIAASDELYINGELVVDLLIPEGVTSVRENAFCGVKTLKTLTLPTTLKTIGKNAFSGCTSLSSVNFAEGLDTIECFAFRNCVSLSEIALPKGLVSIHAGLFFGCTALRYVYIPEESIVNIGSAFDCDCSLSFGSSILSENSNTTLLLGGDSASAAAGLKGTAGYLPYHGFGVSSDLTDVLNVYYGASSADYFTDGDFGFVKSGEGVADLVHYFGDGGTVAVPDTALCGDTTLDVIRIRRFAFLNKEISELHIGKNVTGMTAKIGTDTLKKVTADAENSAFTVVDNVLFTRDMTVLVLYPSYREGEYYSIPESVQMIMSHAFVNPMKLSYLYMPKPESLGEESFVSCRNVVVGTPDYTAIEDVVFKNYGNITISTEGEGRVEYISDGDFRYLVKGGYAHLVLYCGTDTDIVVPASVSYGGKEYRVESISAGAFFRADTLRGVTFEQGIRFIGSMQLNGHVPEGTVFDSTFYFENRSIFDVTNMHVFSLCENLEGIILPDTVTDITGLVRGCGALQNVEFGNGLEYIALGIENCESIQSVVIPPSVKTMELYAIHNCPSLESLTVGTIGMTERNETPTMRIYTWAIHECNNIKTLVMGDEVGKIDGRIPLSVEIFYAGAGFTIDLSTDGLLTGNFKELHFWGDLDDFITYTNIFCTSEHLYLKGELFSGDLVLDAELANLIFNRFERNLDIQRLIITGDNIEIREYKFYYCTSLYEVVVKGEGVKFGQMACPYVTSLVIEGSITVDDSFAPIKTVTVKDIETLFDIGYATDESNPMFYNETTLYIMGSDTPCYEIIIPESVTVIKKCALCGLNFDKFTVVLHDGVTKIEQGAFVWNGTLYYSEAIVGVVYGEWYYYHEDDATSAELFVDSYLSLSAAMLSFDCYWFKL